MGYYLGEDGLKALIVKIGAIKDATNDSFDTLIAEIENNIVPISKDNIDKILRGEITNTE